MELGKPEFRGISADPEWVIESEIGLESVIQADSDQEVVHIVGSSPDIILRQNQHHPRKGVGTRTVRWSNPTTLPDKLGTGKQGRCRKFVTNIVVYN